MFNLIEQMFKNHFKMAAIFTVGIAGLAYFTKPSDESFEKILYRSAPYGAKFDSMDVSIINDNIFYKSTTPSLKNRSSYIGIFNHWIVKNE